MFVKEQVLLDVVKKLEDYRIKANVYVKCELTDSIDTLCELFPKPFFIEGSIKSKDKFKTVNGLQNTKSSLVEIFEGKLKRPNSK